MEISRHCLTIIEKVDKVSQFTTLSQDFNEDFLILLKDTHKYFFKYNISLETTEEFDKIYSDIENYPLLNLWKINKSKISEDFYLFSKDFLTLCDLIIEYEDEQ